jgi:lysyl endopeptidase
MRKEILLVLFSVVFIAYSEISSAQISQGGTPFSFSVPDKSTIKQKVPAIIMPFVDVNQLRAEDVVADQIKNIPWRFGQDFDVDIDCKVEGVMDTLANGDKLWRINIISSGALSINFIFDQFQIPPGAQLFIYNNSKADLIGAFTDFNNRDDSVFATVPLRGDNVFIEYYEPSNADFEGVLHISSVIHGYRGLFEYEKAFGGSGSCNVNVACPQSAGMENQIRSVCHMIVGSYVCSGALINNTANDGTPYVLGADHCYYTPGSVIFWFNWQSATCSNPPSSPSYQSISGSTLKARNSATDFWLVQLSSAPPSNYNVYYSGWNRTIDNNLTGKFWGIHHPSGDIKKISWSTLGVSTTTYLQNPVPGNGTHWRITNWSDGTTTEGGSSGSPLFDPDGRIIGQLHGGYASCSSITSDWYGKLGVSWTGGGTNATRLSNWLDPGNTGVTTLNGYDPNIPSIQLDVQLFSIDVPLDAYCSLSTITPQVNIKNLGSQTLTSATVSYILNGGPAVNTSWTGSLATGQSSVVSFPSISLTLGANQTFVASVTNPNGGSDQNNSNNSLSKNFFVVDEFTLPFTENFNASTNLPSCWSIIDHQGNGQVWQFGTGGSMNGTTGNYAFLNSDAYGSGNSQNSDLVTPTINMTGYTNVTLNFTHYFRQYTGSSATLSYSINNGSTWITIQTWTTSTTNPASFSQIIPAVAGQSQVKFKWNFTGTWGYYWSIDDINITATPSCETPGVPVGLTAVSTGSTTADLSWSSGTPAGSPTVTYFWQIRTTGGSIVTSGSTTGTIATATGLSSNTTYNFRVYASTDCNSTFSSWSINSTNFTTYPTNPVAVGVNPSNVCLGSSSQLFAGGAQGTVYWYSGSCGGTFVGTGNPIVVTPTATTTYYARNYNGHFSTECASGTVTVHTLPGISTAIHGWLCGDGSVNLSVTDVPSGCTIDWYSASSGGTALSTGSEQYTTPFLSSTTTYYAESRNTTTGCVSSNRVPVTATIIPVPSTPLAGMLNSVCEGEALHLTSSTIPGATYTWTGPMGYTSLEQNPTVSQSAVPSMSGHYEVTAEVDGCTSQPGTVDVQIGEVFEYNTTATVCDGNTYLWRGTTYSVAGVYTESYQTVLGCDSLYRLELNVAPVVHQIETTETYEYFLPYIWHGQTIMASGTYNASYQSIWGCDSTFALHLTVFPDPIVKALNVKVYLEGLYSTSNPGTMNQAYHSTGPQYAPGIADMLDIQLYDASTSLTQPVYEQQNVGLQTDGTATIADLPFSLNGEYYIVILHRNSIETWSAQPVIFSGAGPIGYDFTTSSNKAYGNNQKHVGSSHYAIFGGNTNHDIVIDGSDMSQVDNAVTQFMSGYIPEDVNGDGIIDGSDMSIIDNNSTNFIEVKKP